jgi:hypothetical protein
MAATLSGRWLRGTIFYILARHGFAYHGAVANRTIRKSAGADARLIENYDDASNLPGSALPVDRAKAPNQIFDSSKAPGNVRGFSCEPNFKCPLLALVDIQKLASMSLSG